MIEKEITLTKKNKKITRKIIPCLKKQNEIKKDCFAYKEIKTELKDKTKNIIGITCSALNDLYCKKQECRFYKTEKQILNELEKIEKRKGEEI